MAFPTDLDTTDISPAVGGALNEVSAGDDILASVYNIIQSGTVALQTKVGADSSSVTTSHDYILSTLAVLNDQINTITASSGSDLLTLTQGGAGKLIVLNTESDTSETLTVLAVQDQGGAYTEDLVSLQHVHSAAWEAGLVQFIANNKTSTNKTASYTLGVAAGAGGILSFNGGDVAFSADIRANSLESTGSKHFASWSSSDQYWDIYSGGTGSVRIGLASSGDPVEFPAGLSSTDVVTIDVNDASNPALTVDQDNAAGGWINFVGTMGTPTNNDPTTDAPGDWVQVEIAGSTYYLPAYT